MESLSAVCVTGSVGVCGALGACKNNVKSYNTAKFDSLKDTLLAAPRMRPVIGFYIFCATSHKSSSSHKKYKDIYYGEFCLLQRRTLGGTAHASCYRVLHFSRVFTKALSSHKKYKDIYYGEILLPQRHTLSGCRCASCYRVLQF